MGTNDLLVFIFFLYLKDTIIFYIQLLGLNSSGDIVLLNRRLSTVLVCDAHIQKNQKHTGKGDVFTTCETVHAVCFQGLLNKHTFSILPAAYQFKLIQLLPECDRIVGKDNALRLSHSSLHNEFFAKACSEWRERLSEGIA